MTRYRIEIETMYSLFYLKKEYYTYPQALKARRMINFAKYGTCVIKIYGAVDDRIVSLVNTVNSSTSKN